MSVLHKRRVRTRRRRRAAPGSLDLRAEIRIAPRPYFAWKNVLDRTIAALLLVLGLPLIAGLIALVRLTSRGPGLFRQLRVGLNGRQFSMYKIRTMRLDAEAATGPVWTQTDDERITFVGKILRKTHLDELPQLFNVLRGDMSLIGPRPERPEFVKVLARKVPGYSNRLAVRPGITGLAQINLPPDSDVQSVRRKLVLDLEYIENGSLWLDLRILLCTLARLLWLPGERVASLLRVRRKVVLPQAKETAAPEGGNLPPVTPGSIILIPVPDRDGASDPHKPR